MNPEELPLFPLARWELPSDWTEPLVAPATARWYGELFGRTTDWLVRVVSSTGRTSEAFARSLDSQEQGNWWIGFVQPNLLRPWSNYLVSIRSAPQWRKIYLSDEQGSWGLKTRAQDAGTVHLLGSKTSQQSFQMEWPFDFASATPEQTYTEVLRAWVDQTSDLFYARNWLLLSEEEKYARLIHWKRGDERKFKGAMQLVWRAFAPHIADGNVGWTFDPTDNEFTYVVLSYEDLDGEMGEPPALQPWGKALTEVFGPCWNEELTRQHTCLKGYSNAGNRFFVGATERTSHEQLEAARTLRDWLNQRETRGELKAETLAALRETLR